MNDLTVKRAEEIVDAQFFKYSDQQYWRAKGFLEYHEKMKPLVERLKISALNMHHLGEKIPTQFLQDCPVPFCIQNNEVLESYRHTVLG